MWRKQLYCVDILVPERKELEHFEELRNKNIMYAPTIIELKNDGTRKEIRRPSDNKRFRPTKEGATSNAKRQQKEE